MSGLNAALPMYDWPECQREVDSQWVVIRDQLRAAGIDAPDGLTRDFDDIHDLWRRPNLLLAQTCWGPMEHGLASHVSVVGQQNYDGIEGGAGELYSSAIVMRRTNSDIEAVPGPISGRALLPLSLLQGRRLAYNSGDSMSGIVGLNRDLAALGESLAIFSQRLISGGHRKSIQAVADGAADVAAIDCMSWALAQQYEPAAKELAVVGWTARRKGLPFVTAATTPPEIVTTLRAVLA